jgi:hypothetical protein
MRPCRVALGDKQVLFCLEPKASLDREAVSRAAARLTGNCRECMRRIPKFAKMLGCGGQHVAFYQDVSDPSLDEIRRLRDSVPRSREVRHHDLVVVDAKFMTNHPVQVGLFEHVHFTCEELTPDDLAAKLEELSGYLNGSFDNRFQRLVDEPSSLQVIQGEVPKLTRPDHWRSVIDWAVSIASKAQGRKWDQLDAHEKYQLMIFAMLTGRSNGSTHFDMQQASNLVDFMDEAHNTSALRAMMDDRSNPETYQVSRVAALLRDKRVTSLCTVTLTWGGDGQPHKSDLDLHTKVNGQELYYSNKRVGNCQLDFDANASSVEKHPAENISLNQVGSFVFRVNNFNNRDGRDVPFEVTVRKPGFEEMHSGVWPKSGKNGDFMTVCTVRVTAEDLQGKPVELSEAEQKKLAAKEAEWEHAFGEPRSVVASSDDLEVTLVKPAALPRPADGKRAQVAFTQLLAAKPTPAKPTLAQRCELETLSGLIRHAGSKGRSLQVDRRNFVPAYVTRLETRTDVLNARFAINAYHRKNEPPQLPRSDEPSTARFDEAWGLPSRATVHGFVKVGSVWFMVLEGARMPNSASWPLGAGMYPTNLKPEMHHHRSKWSSFHCMVAPSPHGTGTALIGSALVGFSSFPFILNGREITVRCE